MIGTAMAVQMKVKAYRGGGSYASGYHARVSRHDSDSDKHGSSSRGGSERDARDPDAIDGASRPANRLALGRPIGGPSSSSGGLAQASERDTAADEAVGPSRMSSDHPAFNKRPMGQRIGENARTQVTVCHLTMDKSSRFHLRRSNARSGKTIAYSSFGSQHRARHKRATSLGCGQPYD